MLYIDIDWEKEGEIWKPHPKYDYSFSSFGRSRNDSTGRISRITCYPYRLYVGNYVRKGFHRLVYESWYGLIPDGLLVQHYDENLPLPFLNGPNNLSLGTDSTNSKDRRDKDRGHRPKGSTNPRTNLTERDVLLIRELWNKRREDIGPNSQLQPVTYKILERIFEVSTDQLCDIINRHTWNHI